MRLGLAFCLLVTLPVAASAQEMAGAPACKFDTAAHTDTLTLELSLRAFRGKDTIPDKLLTRGFGDMIRSHLVQPPTIAHLFYPYTYFSAKGSHNFAATYGTFQFSLAPDGAMKDFAWYVIGPDSTIDAALETAFNKGVAEKEVKDLADFMALKESEAFRIQFVARADTTTRSPLLRVRIPMLRIEQDTVATMKGKWSTVKGLVAHMYVAPAPYPGGIETIVDETGHPTGIAEPGAPTQFSKAMVGGCAVRYRVLLPDALRP